MRVHFRGMIVGSLAVLALAPARPALGGDKRTDLQGDPLPAGAIARMGTARFHHPGGIVAGAYAPDGKTILAVGPEDKDGYSLRFWDTFTGKETARVKAAVSGVRGAAFTPDGRIAGLCTDHCINLYDVKSGELLRSFTPKGQERGAATLSFAFSPDGKLVAAGCMEYREDNPVRVWEVDTGKELPPFLGRGASLNAVAFSADGTRLLSGPTGSTFGIDGKVLTNSICVWDVASRKLIRQIQSDRWNFAFAPSGQALAYENNGLDIIDIKTGKSICLVPGAHAILAFSSDSKHVLALLDRSTLVLLDAASGKTVRRFEGSVGYTAKFLGFSGDGKRLAMTDGGWQGDGAVRQWDVGTGKEILLFVGHQNHVTQLAFSPDGKMLASVSPDQTARLWDPATGKQLRVLQINNLTAVAFSPDGKVLACAGPDSTSLWNPAAGERLAAFDHPLQTKPFFGAHSVALNLGFSTDGKTLLAARGDGLIHSFDWKVRKKLLSTTFDKESTTPPLVLPHAAAVVTVDGGEFDLQERATEALYVWSVNGKLLQTIPLRSKREQGYSLLCTGLAASPDEKILVSSQVVVSQSLRGPVYHDPVLSLWERSTGKELIQIKGVSSALAFSADSRLLAVDDGGMRSFWGNAGSTNFGATVTVYDTLTGQRLGRLAKHNAQVHCIAFSPDGALLATGSADNTILVWKTPERKQPPVAAINQEDAKKYWDGLGDKDAALAYHALGKLVHSPQAAVELLRDKLKPVVGIDPKEIDPLIKDFDSAQFPVRNQAVRKLQAMGEFAEPALRAALAAATSLESRRRMESLLERLAVPMPDYIQKQRALTVLERIGDAPARQLLEAMAKGANSRLTDEAQACLLRLDARKKMTEPK